MDKELKMCIAMYVIIFLWAIICPFLANDGEDKRKRSKTMAYNNSHSVILGQISSYLDRCCRNAYQQGRTDCLEEFVKNVLYELNGIAEDESYYFDKDNANLVSSVMYSHLEQLKEQKNGK